MFTCHFPLFTKVKHRFPQRAVTLTSCVVYKNEFPITGTQINDLEQKEEINIQPEQNEETSIQKNEERLRKLQDNFNVPTSKS